MIIGTKLSCTMVVQTRIMRFAVSRCVDWIPLLTAVGRRPDSVDRPIVGLESWPGLENRVSHPDTLVYLRVG